MNEEDDMGRGRPTKYTRALQDTICAKLRKTLPVEKSCALVGISVTTYENWCRRGALGEAPFAQFLEAVSAARAAAQEFWVDVCAASTVDRSVNPAAAFYVLERSDRKNWGREVKPEPGTTLDSKDVLREYLRRGRPGDTPPAPEGDAQ